MPGLVMVGKAWALLLFKPGFIYSFFNKTLIEMPVGNVKTSPYPCWTYILLDLSPSFVIYFLGKQPEVPKTFQVSVHL